MINKKSLILNIEVAGDKIQSKSITNISQTASDFDLKTFAHKLNSLTNNTIRSIETVTRSDITDALDPTDPQFTINPAVLDMMSGGASTSPIDEGASVTFQFDYRGSQREITMSGGKKFVASRATYALDQANKTLTITGRSGGGVEKGPNSFTTTFSLAAGDGFDAATVTLEVKFVDSSIIEDV